MHVGIKLDLWNAPRNKLKALGTCLMLVNTVFDKLVLNKFELLIFLVIE